MHKFYLMLDANSFEYIKTQSTMLREVQSPAFGTGQLMQYRERVLFLGTKTFDSFRKYEQMRDETKFRLGILEPTLATLYKYKTFENSALCGSYYTIQFLCQYSPNTIENLRPTEQEVLQIIQDVVKALMTLVQHKMRHGMLSPKTILKAAHNYQLTDIRYLTDMYEYQLQLTGFVDKCYLSPQLFEELGKRSQNPIYNYEKCEVFSLGLVLLETALQQQVQNIYDFDRYVVSSDVIETHLRVLGDRYPRTLVDLLARMLSVNEERRASLKELAGYFGGNLSKSLGYRSTTPKAETPSTPKKRIFGERYTPTASMVTPTNVQQTQKYKVQHSQSPSNHHQATKASEVTRPLKSSQMNYFKSSQTHQYTSRSPKEMDEKFDEFNKDLAALKSKVNHLRINTQSSVNQSEILTAPFYHSHQFPTFKPTVSTQFPHEVDLRMEDQGDYFSQIDRKIRDLKFDSYQYTSHSQYDDSRMDARLPQSATIHMHSSGPTQLSDFFLKRK